MQGLQALLDDLLFPVPLGDFFRVPLRIQGQMGQGGNDA